MYSDQSIGSSSAGSSASSFAFSSGESSLSRSSCSATSSTSSSSGFWISSCFKICCSSRVGTWSSLSACCSRGVMMSAGRSDMLSDGFNSMAIPILKRETLAEVDFPSPGVLRQLFRSALQQDPALVHDIGPVGDAKRFPHVVVRDQYAQAAIPQSSDDILD